MGIPARENAAPPSATSDVRPPTKNVPEIQPATLSGAEAKALDRQRWIARLLSPIWVPLTVVWMRWIGGWTIEGCEEARRHYREVLDRADGAVVICANHLTMVDSFLLTWALGSISFYLRRFHALPWNLPEARNFASTRLARFLIYVLKCLPIRRGADQGETGRVLSRLSCLLGRGDTALVFPEGGRSRNGRVNVDARTYGVGRILRHVENPTVVCVYMRGSGQTSWSRLPRRGERFRVLVDSFRPQTTKHGLRASLDLSHQVLERLATLESRYFELPN